MSVDTPARAAEKRPHRALHQRSPAGRPHPPALGASVRVPPGGRPGGLIHEYLQAGRIKPTGFSAAVICSICSSRAWRRSLTVCFHCPAPVGRSSRATIWSRLIRADCCQKAVIARRRSSARAAADRRVARRPLRPQTALPGRHRRVHHRLGHLRCRARCRRANRRPGHPRSDCHQPDPRSLSILTKAFPDDARRA
jgi:hypothetical protein